MDEDIPIGIDLGTTYSCVGVFRGNKVEIIPNTSGNNTTPSVVTFSKKMLVGDEAKAQITKDYKNTIYDTKRLIGRQFDDPIVQKDMKNWPFKVEKDPKTSRPLINVEFKGKIKKFYPEDISAIILQHMKNIAETYLGRKVTNAIITVPAYFNDAQRQATKDAGRIAGLNVLRMINEPTSAALAYRLFNKVEEDKNVLVFDLGGGTFDVSIVSVGEDACEVISTRGDTHLGGGDFDNELMNYCIQEFKNNTGVDIEKNEKAKRRLKKECEKAKIFLSSAKETTIELDSLAEGKDLNLEITRALFESKIKKYLDQCIQCVNEALKDAKFKQSQIDEIVLVGGSSKIPIVQQMLKDYFGKEPNKSIHPDEAVAYGAAYQAASIQGLINEEDGLEQLVLIDVIPLSLGVAVGGEIMDIVVPRNTKIPITNKSKTYVTAADYQDKVLIEVYQGERVQVKDNSFIGEFLVEGLQKKKAGEVSIKVNFNVDVDSILNVNAEEIVKGKKKGEASKNKIQVKEYKKNLSDQEIENRVEQLKNLTEEQKENDLATVERVNLQMLCLKMMSNEKAKEYYNWSVKNKNERKEEYIKRRKELENLK